MNRRILGGLALVVLGVAILYVGLVNVEGQLSGDTLGCDEYATFGPRIADNGGIVYSKGPCSDYRYGTETVTGSLLLGFGSVGLGVIGVVTQSQ